MYRLVDCWRVRCGGMRNICLRRSLFFLTLLDFFCPFDIRSILRVLELGCSRPSSQMASDSTAKVKNKVLITLAFFTFVYVLNLFSAKVLYGLRSPSNNYVSSWITLIHGAYSRLLLHCLGSDEFRYDELGTFQCPNCDYKKVDIKHKSVRHLLSHLEDREHCPYKCPFEECNYANVDIDNVKAHVRKGHKREWTEDLVRMIYCPSIF